MSRSEISSGETKPDPSEGVISKGLYLIIQILIFYLALTAIFSVGHRLSAGLSSQSSQAAPVPKSSLRQPVQPWLTDQACSLY